MRTSVKVISALSVAGLAVAAGSAFTGAGLTNSAGATQFIGGEVTQAVTGATLTNLEYGFVADGTQTAVNQVTLTFAAGADTKAVLLELTGGGTAVFDCDPITANVSVCDPTVLGATKTDVTSATVTVS
ncbi:hypothetical protein [Arthrobacter sp. B6]|uniref:hypothetical protein n=1 Tax=Arthrobacter sp. B6 TaxID=1570137 RepID=UPI000836A38C|nr:hypothetical protein [Arthrobacter sp. B6]